MRICTNCGASNGDDTHVCRKCGAILPVSSSPPHLRMNFGNKADHSQQVNPFEDTDELSEDLQNTNSPNLYGEMKFFSGSSSINNSKAQEKQKQKHKHKQKKSIKKPSQSDLNEIPIELESKPSYELESQNEETLSEEFDPLDFELEKKEYLKEIDPIPFDGTFLTPSYRKKSTKPVQPLQSEKKIMPKSDKSSEITPAPTLAPASKHTLTPPPLNPNKQKRLAKDMKSVLSFLSEKLPVSPTPEKSSIEDTKEKKEIPPSNMDDILKQLLRIDTHIEASAIIKSNGRIMASAISDRASDSLFSTIAQNLYMIGTDIIEGLNAGILRSISLRGTEGVLDLAPISIEKPEITEYILIIFSNPKVKSAIILIATSFVKKQLKLFFNNQQ